MKRVGVWLIGARGSIAGVTLAGHAALLNGAAPTGLVTARADFEGVDLIDLEALVFGGHEITDGDLVEATRGYLSAHQLSHLMPEVEARLHAVEARIRPGIVRGGGARIEALARRAQVAATDRQAVDLIRADLDAFKAAEGLERLIMVNLASTEPPPPPQAAWETPQALYAALGGAALPPSSLYALAAFEGGDAYINFTPSLGSRIPALEAIAEAHGAVHMGSDGKTGETLVKSILAELFTRRNLTVSSWFGQNILGNGDGQVLSDPANKASKIQTKDQLLPKILGYHPQTHVGIDYVGSLGEWKVAWDHIHFQGFMGAPMTMEFTWRGLDSVLAAPLVLDLIRLASLAQERGEVGVLTALAPFFKDPHGCDEQRLISQDEALLAWVKAGALG
ncbi:inositol-3-phosphate synthase [Myxococcota bacterium]|nr:inositol-3-phosphate synthase [Myxococcota bacterium]MBU1431579.1 inositol-3-phosphate synthase [Myxococcota bacterium]MBU1897380.1 inositol-3-phosphate synthase [Myxococcota bacterium]